nr:DUF6541 family protein [Corynebacterium lactis]
MVWPIVALVLLLVVPGFLVALSSGTRAGWSLAMGPAVTFGVVGIAGWVYGAVGVRYGVLSAALACLIFVLLAVGWRILMQRLGGVGSREPRKTAPDWRTALPAAVGIVASAGVLATTAIRRISALPQGMETIQQTWDVLWHASVIRSIVDNGMASPTRMGEIQNVETHDQSFYPAAWHALGSVYAQVSGQPLTAVLNYLGIILPAVLIPLAAAALAWRIVDRPGVEASFAAGLAAVVSATLPVLMPIGVFVSAWPYQVAIALAVIVFAFVTSVPHAPSRIFVSVMGLLGAGMVHPSAVPTVLVLGGMWWLFFRVWAPAHPYLGAVKSRLYDVGLILAVVVPAVALLLPQWAAGGGQRDDILEVSAEVDVSRFASWYRGVTMLTRHAEEYRPFWFIIILGVLGIALVTFGRRLGAPQRLWVAPAWALSVVFVTHAIRHFSGPVGTVVAKYTDLHYSTPHRLVMVTAFIISASAGVLLARACVGFGKERFSFLLALVCVAILIPYGVFKNSDVARFAYDSPRKWELISPADLSAFDWLAEQPEAREHRTFTSPAQGSSWMYPRNGVPVVFPHYDWPSANADSATAMLYWHANLLGAGVPNDPTGENTVDQAAKVLDVAFVYVSPPDYWNNHKTPDTLGPLLASAPGLAPVYKDKEVVIYALRSVVSPQRIAQMQATSPEPISSLRH